MTTHAPPNLDDILRLLNTATDRGTLRWGETVEEETFRAQLRGWIIRVAKDLFSGAYNLSVIDAKGTTLVEEYRPAEEGQRLAVEALHKKARHQALNLDGKLQTLVEMLKTAAGEC